MFLQKIPKFRKEYKHIHRQRYGISHAMMTKGIGIFKCKNLIGWNRVQSKILNASKKVSDKKEIEGRVFQHQM